MKHLKTEHIRRGFSLVELLIVITIMGVMLAIGGTGINGMLTSMRMRDAVESTRNALEYARQVAMTSNRDVVFRIYKASNDTGEFAWRTIEYGVAKIEMNPENTGYQDPTLTTFKPKFTSVAAAEKLPTGIVFHPSSQYSQLLDTAQPKLEKGSDTGPDGQSREYIGFRFLPDGRCSLSAAENWTLTLVEEKASTDAFLPSNYATMQLDPTTARVRVFRP